MSSRMKILYFIASPFPTPEDYDAVNDLRKYGDVYFRNADAVHEEASTEACDAVAGLVPENYAAKYPTPEEAMEQRKLDLLHKSGKAGETEPPAAAPAAAGGKQAWSAAAAAAASKKG